jgi:hypothetical protein
MEERSSVSMPTRCNPRAWAPASAAARDVLVALAIKLGLLAVLYGCFFGEGHRPRADPGAVAFALLDRHAGKP